MKPTTPNPHRRFLHTMSILLTIIMFIKLGGFFTWNEDVGVTRALKLVSRLAMTAAAYGTYRLVVRRGAVDSFRWHNSASPLLYGAYFLLGLLSLLWSRNPGYSLLQWLMDFETLVFAYFLVKTFLLLDAFFPGSPVRFYHVLGNSAFMLLAIFLVGMLVAPDTFYRLTHDGEEARLGGFIMNPNELGMLCVVGIACLIFNFYRQHRFVWTTLKIVALLTALILTGSRSSLVGFLLIVFFHIQQSSNTRLKVSANLAVMIAVPLIVPVLFVKQGGLDEVLDMTGRLPFWTALLTEGLPREPLLGYGFMRIAYGEYFQSVHTYAAQMAHNTFIQVLMNLGIVGGVIVYSQLAFTIRGFLASADVQLKLLGVGILIPIIINSFTEFGIFGMTNYGILFYQFLICFVSMRYHPRLSFQEQRRLYLRRPELVGQLG